jgi:SP family general alpha glucoside:H+ symporter-like MFS transporter
VSNSFTVHGSPSSGIFIASWFQDRYGYRRTIQIGLILMTAFIFIVFFSTSIEMLFVGQLLCGIPWGCFASVSVAAPMFLSHS